MRMELQVLIFGLYVHKNRFCRSRWQWFDVSSVGEVCISIPDIGTPNVGHACKFS